MDRLLSVTRSDASQPWARDALPVRVAFGPRARHAARGFVRVAATRHLTFLRIA